MPERQESPVAVLYPSRSRTSDPVNLNLCPQRAAEWQALSAPLASRMRSSEESPDRSGRKLRMAQAQFPFRAMYAQERLLCLVHRFPVEARATSVREDCIRFSIDRAGERPMGASDCALNVVSSNDQVLPSHKERDD